MGREHRNYAENDSDPVLASYGTMLHPTSYPSPLPLPPSSPPRMVQDLGFTWGVCGLCKNKISMSHLICDYTLRMCGCIYCKACINNNLDDSEMKCRRIGSQWYCVRISGFLPGIRSIGWSLAGGAFLKNKR